MRHIHITVFFWLLFPSCCPSFTVGFSEFLSKYSTALKPAAVLVPKLPGFKALMMLEAFYKTA